MPKPVRSANRKNKIELGFIFHYNTAMITCILLAAGESMRFQSPKALASLQNQTIIQRLQFMLVASDIDQIIIVLGAHREKIEPLILKHPKIQTVYNKDFKMGQTSSFQTGLHAAQSTPLCEAVLLLLVDYPLISLQTINYLKVQYIEKRPLVIIPTYQEKKGHPPLFSSLLFAELLALDPQEGVNTIIHRYENALTLLEVNDSGVIQTFNTLEEFKTLCAQLK